MSKELYRYILDCLAQRQRLVMATVISRSGSGPREAGASLAVNGDGVCLGTVGGGLLEAQVISAAQEVLRTACPVCLTFSLTAKEVASGGMLCGGRVEVLVDLLEGINHLIMPIFAKIIDAQEKGRGVWLIRSICPGEPGKSVVTTASETALPVIKSPVRTGLGLMEEENLNFGSLDIDDLTIDELKRDRRRAETVLITKGDDRYLLQPVVPPGRIIIAGAGHVAQELATLCNFLEFRAVVIDDRREFAGRDRFPAAEIVIAKDSFQDCFLGIEIDGDCCIVIVTRGHEHDRNVLAKALRTGAGYVGMIGSRRKRDAIYRSLCGDGFSEEDLARVHCPIGIAIGARTPAEIAVSIMAELIAHRVEKSF